MLLLFVCYFYLVIYSIRVSITIRVISVITVHVQYGNIQADSQEEEKKTEKLNIIIQPGIKINKITPSQFNCSIK